ncbi:hypothetical protein [Nitrospira moscoviensis]|uniref:Lipoprotein n=1 Tax=Nitrospira moscoviensis TaxID=42253 RepID=A0A0K2G7N4_NITMO|nr:hypothetical protein [Nitrospira moscoviensis]ALA56884.1 exported protein of unknown function [Nitrospira moscoviensis]
MRRSTAKAGAALIAALSLVGCAELAYQRVVYFGSLAGSLKTNGRIAMSISPPPDDQLMKWLMTNSQRPMAGSQKQIVGKGARR